MKEAESKRASMLELGPFLLQAMASGASAELTVTGRSMRPLLLDRISMVRLTAVTEPKRGDMVLYRRKSGDYVLHRIVRCAADGSYTLCGDGQTVKEPGIRREQLIAQVQAFARRKSWQSCTALPYSLWWRIHLADLPLRRFLLRSVSFLKRRLSGLFRANPAPESPEKPEEKKEKTGGEKRKKLDRQA